MIELQDGSRKRRHRGTRAGRGRSSAHRQSRQAAAAALVQHAAPQEPVSSQDTQGAGRPAPDHDFFFVQRRALAAVLVAEDLNGLRAAVAPIIGLSPSTVASKATGSTAHSAAPPRIPEAATSFPASLLVDA